MSAAEVPTEPAPSLPLDVLTCPLRGVSLIEASAGTGKTWSICALYARLLLACELPVQSILVVTFTNAAAAELRERIRSRLVQLQGQLQGQLQVQPQAGVRPQADPAPFTAGGLEAGRADPLMAALLQQLRGAGHTDQALGLALDLALQTFDEAAIFTIHGFCQRALADAPFAAGMPLAQTLLADDRAMRADVVHDFWRRHVAGPGLPPALGALMRACDDSPRRWAALLARRTAKPLARLRWPQAMDERAEIAEVAATDAAAMPKAMPAAMAAAMAAAAALWTQQRDAILATLTNPPKTLNAKVYKPATVAGAALRWDALLAGPGVDLHDADATKVLRLFTASRLAACTNARKSTPAHPFFNAAERLLNQRAAEERAVVLQRLALLRKLLTEAPVRLRAMKREQRVVAYDDLLQDLHERLTAGHAPWLADALRQRFAAALVDEFQDTDPLQFAIFNTLYGQAQAQPPQPQPPQPPHPPQPPQQAQQVQQAQPPQPPRQAPLFLVGDPKQAIYGFRNADLHTYLDAARRAHARYALTHNQRATAPLIAALNGLFSDNPQAFMLPGLHYHPVDCGAKPRKPLNDRSGTTAGAAPAASTAPTASSAPPVSSAPPASSAAPASAGPTRRVAANVATPAPRPPAPAALQLWTLPRAADGAPAPKAQLRSLAAGACAAEIARLLQAAQAGLIDYDGRPLRAGDIAVLVRSHAHGAQVRQALQALAVGSVSLSPASVWASSEAFDVQCVLAAVLAPGRERLLRAALATDLMGLDAAAVFAVSADEALLMQHFQHFAAARRSWQDHGVGRMLRQFFLRSGVVSRLLSRADGERRLTNLLHVTEALQTAAETHTAPEALLRWLQAQRAESTEADAASATDEAQLRLESDRNLVQIVTIHKAKGLEYPIVFCPLLWDGHPGPPPAGGDCTEYHDADGHLVMDFRLLDDEDTPQAVTPQAVTPQTAMPQTARQEVALHKQAQRAERCAEQLRLIYVALTRASQRCVLIVGSYSSGRGANVSECTRAPLNWLVAGAGLSPQQWLEAVRSADAIDLAWARWAQTAPAVAATSTAAAATAPATTAPATTAPATTAPATTAPATTAASLPWSAAVSIAPLPQGPAQPLREVLLTPTALSARDPPAFIAPAWRFGSYSSLVQGARSEAAAVDHDARSAMTAAVQPGLPEETADALNVIAAIDAIDAIDAFDAFDAFDAAYDTDAVDGAGPTDLTGRADPVDPTDLMGRDDSADHSEFNDRADSADPTQHAHLAQSTLAGKAPLTGRLFAPPATRISPTLRLHTHDIVQFPRGAMAGECVHRVFEQAEFTDPTHWPAVIERALQSFPQRSSKRSAVGWATDAAIDLRPGSDAGTATGMGTGKATGMALIQHRRSRAADPQAAMARMLHHMLDDVLHTPLHGTAGGSRSGRLCEVPRGKRLVELEFNLPAPHLEAGALMQVLGEYGYRLPPLAFAPLRGYLRGFIDLVFEQDSRYWLLDWKSNHLGATPQDYDRAALRQVMDAQGYFLQALLYAVALHRHLRRRLPQYHYETHFGGVHTVFVRGVRPHWTLADGAPAGVVTHRPSAAAVMALDRLLAGPRSAQHAQRQP